VTQDRSAATAGKAYCDAAAAESNLWRWTITILRGRIRTHVCYKVAVFCGISHVTIQPDLFTRSATVLQRYRQTDRQIDTRTHTHAYT